VFELARENVSCISESSSERSSETALSDASVVDDSHVLELAREDVRDHETLVLHSHEVWVLGRAITRYSH
jgi:hypothetical protein